MIDQRLGEGRIVDVQVQFDQPAIGTRPKFAFQGLEQHSVSRRVVKRLAGGIDQRHPFQGQQKPHGPLHPVELGGDEASE